jgi:hypothetical protein
MGERGTEDQKALLERRGFRMEQDCEGDLYYVLGGTGHIVHLYPGGTWSSEEAPKAFSSLQEYLAWIRGLRTDGRL